MRKAQFRLLAGMLVLANMAALASCGDQSGTEPKQTEKAGGETVTETVQAEPEYVYPELDMNEEEFMILDTKQEYGFYTTLDVEGETGEALDDAIYKRNRFLEEQFNFRLKINAEFILENSQKALSTAVMAGEDVYDCAFLRDINFSAPLMNGDLENLAQSDYFHFDSPWWDSENIEMNRLGEGQNVFYAFTDISLADFEGTCCMFFNEKYLTNLDLELPFDLVRNGKWTIDKLDEYIVAGANMNSQSSYEWETYGDALYGIAGYGHTTDALIIGSDVEFYKTDAGKNIVCAAEGEKFFNAAMRVVELLSDSSKFVFLNSNPDPLDHYEMAFKNGRCIFMVAQLKAANKYRDMDDSFGIVPMPKADEAQKDYRCLRSFSYMLCVPVTNNDLDSTAIILDAMSYHTYRDIMPYYYNYHTSQKLLRTEDSVEMLDIINTSRYFDVGDPFGLSTNLLRDVFRNSVGAGSHDLVSGVEKIRGNIDTKIAEIMDILNREN